MVNMKCEICGEVWTKDDSYVGMEIKCPNCQGRCKCLTDDEKDEQIPDIIVSKSVSTGYDKIDLFKVKVPVA